MSYDILEAKNLSLWLSFEESTTRIRELANDYIRKADELTTDEPVNSINLRSQGLGLLQALEIIGKTLRDRELLP